MTDSSIHIAARFNGPPHSANGGYVCGCMAREGGGRCVETRLMAPPPLDTDLAVRHEGDQWFALHEQRPLARARHATLPVMTVPAPPSLAQAREAEKGFIGFVDHPFSDCYVCGPNRADGLRLFPGWLADHRAVACPWHPASELDDGNGRVALPYLYAALDCPGSFTLKKDPGTVVLLGSFTVQVDEAPPLDEPLVVTGWRIGREGRKHYAGTAVHNAQGRCLARAHAVWIQIPADGR